MQKLFSLRGKEKAKKVESDQPPEINMNTKYSERLTTPIVVDADQFYNLLNEAIDHEMDPVTKSMMHAQIAVKCSQLWTLSPTTTEQLFQDLNYRMRYIIILFSFILAPPIALFSEFLYELTSEFCSSKQARSFTECIDILTQHMKVYQVHLCRNAATLAKIEDPLLISRERNAIRISEIASLQHLTPDEQLVNITKSQIIRLFGLFYAGILPVAFKAFIVVPCCENSILVKERKIGLLMPMTPFTDTILDYANYCTNTDQRETWLKPSEIDTVKVRADRNVTYVAATVAHMFEEGHRLSSIAASEPKTFRRAQTFEMPSLSDIKAEMKANKSTIVELDSHSQSSSNQTKVSSISIIDSQIRNIVTRSDVPEPLHIVKIRKARASSTDEHQPLGVIFCQHLTQRAKDQGILRRVDLGVPDELNHFIRFKTNRIDERIVTPEKVRNNDTILTIADYQQSQGFIVTFDPKHKIPIYNEIRDSFNNRMDLD